MIEWLNRYQGLILAALTAIYVFATIVMARMMSRSNELMRKSLDLAVHFERARSRPFVLFDIVLEDHIARLQLRNVGRTAARHVKVHLTPAVYIESNSSTTSS